MRRRILVVDDHRRTVKTLGDVLHAHGWEAAAAYSAEAIRTVTTQTFTTVLMDVRTTVLILCSGHPDTLNPTVARLPAAWVCASLRKPCPPEQLVALLNAL